MAAILLSQRKKVQGKFSLFFGCLLFHFTCMHVLLQCKLTTVFFLWWRWSKPATSAQDQAELKHFLQKQPAIGVRTVNLSRTVLPHMTLPSRTRSRPLITNVSELSLHRLLHLLVPIPKPRMPKIRKDIKVRPDLYIPCSLCPVQCSCLAGVYSVDLDLYWPWPNFTRARVAFTW